MRKQFVAAVAALVVVAAIVPSVSASTTWTARLGTYGVATIRVGSPDKLSINAKNFRPRVAYPVSLRRGSCARLGTLVMSTRLTTSSAGTIVRTLYLTRAQTSAAKIPLSLRIGTRCAAFSAPAPTPAPTPTPTPRLSCTIATIHNASALLYAQPHFSLTFEMVGGYFNAAYIAPDRYFQQSLAWAGEYPVERSAEIIIGTQRWYEANNSNGTRGPWVVGPVVGDPRMSPFGLTTDAMTDAEFSTYALTYSSDGGCTFAKPLVDPLSSPGRDMISFDSRGRLVYFVVEEFLWEIRVSYTKDVSIEPPV